MPAVLFATAFLWPTIAVAAEPDSAYHHEGELAGSLRKTGPLPIYDDDPKHLWNRLFAAFYIRKSNLPAKQGGRPIERIEGGDYIDFLAWGGSTYWSSESMLNRIDRLLEEFLSAGGHELIRDPLKRALLLRDLWAPFDHYVGQNMRRVGSPPTRSRRSAIAAKLGRVIASLTLSPKEIAALPDNYSAAVTSKAFVNRPDFRGRNDYLPEGLFTRPDEWVEIDFFQPDLHEDLYKRFITLHTRSYRGRSYFRIFYRFPGGREKLRLYLRRLEDNGIDWKRAAQNGFILFKKDAPQIPVGVEVALVQFMMTIDDRMRPTPTSIVESLRHRVFRNVDGRSLPDTNTGVGMHVMEYTLKRRLLFNGLERGGLHREADDAPLYRVIFQPPNAPDWGTDRRKVLFQQCADCHMTPKADRPGVHSMPSIVHMGGFDAGAQLGVALPLDPTKSGVRGKRAARWKTQHETFRRLLDYLGR